MQTQISEEKKSEFLNVNLELWGEIQNCEITKNSEGGEAELQDGNLEFQEKCQKSAEKNQNCKPQIQRKKSELQGENSESGENKPELGDGESCCMLAIVRKKNTSHCVYKI